MNLSEFMENFQKQTTVKLAGKSRETYTEELMREAANTAEAHFRTSQEEAESLASSRSP